MLQGVAESLINTGITGRSGFGAEFSAVLNPWRSLESLPFKRLVLCDVTYKNCHHSICQDMSFTAYSKGLLYNFVSSLRNAYRGWVPFFLRLAWGIEFLRSPLPERDTLSRSGRVNVQLLASP